jgi:micrococcal nuclease
VRRCLAAALLAALSLLTSGCGDSLLPPPTDAVELPPCDWTEVVRVVDGDTIIVRIDGAQDRVRYIGIDTPELPNFGNPEEPFARAATEANEALVEDGQVCLERDISERDSFDRLLRYTWLADGRLVEEELVRQGLAEVVTFPPDVKYHDSRLIPAQRQAREAGVGIWAEDE